MFPQAEDIDVEWVDQHTLYRALDDLQRRVMRRMPELTEEHSVLRYGPDYVVIDSSDGLIATALAGYSDRTWEAIARVHARSYPFDTPQSTTPLHVMTAPDELARISEVTTKKDASGHTHN